MFLLGLCISIHDPLVVSRVKQEQFPRVSAIHVSLTQYLRDYTINGVCYTHIYMTNTSKALSLTTREKISLSKTKYTKPVLIDGGVAYIDNILNEDEKKKTIPSIVGLCLYIGISRSRIYELADKWQEVSDILEYIRMMQEDKALQGGMTNRLNPIFSMFLLKGKHSYIDTAPALNQTNNFNISPDLLADAIKLMREKNKVKG